jgi:hypothetical protein
VDGGLGFTVLPLMQLQMSATFTWKSDLKGEPGEKQPDFRSFLTVGVIEWHFHGATFCSPFLTPLACLSVEQGIFTHQDINTLADLSLQQMEFYLPTTKHMTTCCTQ